MRSVCLVTALWKRPELTRIIAEYYARIAQSLYKDYVMDLTLLAVRTPGDEQVPMRGWDYTEADNSPLSQKFNHVFQAAREFSPDVVILAGSDDLLTRKLIITQAMAADQGIPVMVGLKDLYFWETATDKAIRFKGFIGNKKDYTIGCARAFSRMALDRLEWKPWGREQINRGLDLCCSRRLKVTGVEERQVEMKDAGAAVDVKTNVNITQIETFFFNFEATDPKEVFEDFPGMRELIQKIPAHDNSPAQ